MDVTQSVQIGNRPPTAPPNLGTLPAEYAADKAEADRPTARNPKTAEGLGA